MVFALSPTFALSLGEDEIVLIQGQSNEQDNAEARKKIKKCEKIKAKPILHAVLLI